MNAFSEKCKVELRAMELLRPLFQELSVEHHLVEFSGSSRLAYSLQTQIGDLIINAKPNGDLLAIEVKSEEKNSTGNFFIETWSNLSRFTRGWVYTLNTDILVYCFLEPVECYWIQYEKLRQWLFNGHDQYESKPNIDKYSERKQRKTEQLNDTWGRCVPISQVERHVGFTKYAMSNCGSGWQKVPGKRNGELF